MQQILYQREVLIDAPLTHVWQLVATEEGLRQWWGNTIHLEAKEGGRCEEWRPSRAGMSHWQGVVTLYAPPHELMMTLRAQEPQAETPEFTTISISLEAKGEQTRVYVTQRAFGMTTTTEVEQPQVPVPVPGKRQTTPLAQLQRPAPGALPIPAPLPVPATGRGLPNRSLTPQATDAVILTWQGRIERLLASAATGEN